MGKGEIISHTGEGLYQVKLIHDRRFIDKALERLNQMIAWVDSKIAGFDPGDDRIPVFELMKASYEKRIEYINDLAPEDPTVSAWCGDYTTDLTGYVGTIEVDGQTDEIQIYPGYGDEADYNASRDGQLASSMAMSPETTFFNFAMMPGWQRWKPTFKHAILSNLQIRGNKPDLCTITLTNAPSEILGLTTIAQVVYNNVEIDYMSCDGEAFSNGQEVLVMFESQDPTKPKVIGHKDHPPPCEKEYVYIKCSASGETTYSIVWDVMAKGYAKLYDPATGAPITFPCEDSDLAWWVSYTTSVSNGNIFSWVEAKDTTWAPDETPVLSNNTGCGDLYYHSTNQVESDYRHAYGLMVASGLWGSSWNLTIQNNVTGTSCKRVRVDYTQEDKSDVNPNWAEKDYQITIITPIGTAEPLSWDFEALITDETTCLTGWTYRYPDYEIVSGDYYETVEHHAKYSDKVIVQIYVYEWILLDFTEDPEATKTCYDGFLTNGCDDCSWPINGGNEILVGSKANVAIDSYTRQRRCLAAANFYDNANNADPRDQEDDADFAAAIDELHAAFYSGNNISDATVDGTYTVDIRK